VRGPLRVAHLENIELVSVISVGVQSHLPLCIPLQTVIIAVWLFWILTLIYFLFGMEI